MPWRRTIGLWYLECLWYWEWGHTTDCGGLWAKLLSPMAGWRPAGPGSGSGAVGPRSLRWPELRSCSGDRLDLVKTFQKFICLYGAVVPNLPVEILHHQAVCPRSSSHLGLLFKSVSPPVSIYRPHVYTLLPLSQPLSQWSLARTPRPMSRLRIVTLREPEGEHKSVLPSSCPLRASRSFRRWQYEWHVYGEGAKKLS